MSDEKSFLAAGLDDQRRALEGLSPAEAEIWLRLLERDARVGRRRLARTLRNAQGRRRRSEERWLELSRFDAQRAEGLRLAGVDEVGRGPMAGPVTAGALILPPGYRAPGLDDSKRMSPQGREAWAARLRDEALAWAVADVDPETIDRVGIRQAALTAMARALRGLPVEPERVIVDGVDSPPVEAPSLPIIGGDARSLSIAGASVLAKVHRDGFMRRCHERWPHYGFDRHKGYGSEEHRRAFLRWGPCPIHRRSFCAGWLAELEQPTRRPPG